MSHERFEQIIPKDPRSKEDMIDSKMSANTICRHTPQSLVPAKKTTSHRQRQTTKQLRIANIFKCTSKGLVICGLGSSGLEIEKYGSENQLTS